MPVRNSITLLMLAVATIFVALAAWAQAPKKEWKDRAEYDLYDAAVKQIDNTKKLELLTTWRDKYPSSDYKTERLQLTLGAHVALHQADKVMEVGAEILAADPKNTQALYLMTVNALALKPTPELLGMAEKAARGLASSLDSLFAPDKKPAATSDADWKKGRTDIEAVAHTTLGWLAMSRKENEAAEKEFTQSLKANPDNAQVSYWLANVIILQKNADKQSAALFHIARAAFYSGTGALNDDGKKPISEYLTKTYTSFHGSAEGLDELRKTAAAQAFPPDGFKIASKGELELQKEEAFKKANPMLALWTTVKNELTGSNGQAYFGSSVKGALLPGGAGGVTKFKGRLISMKPPKAPKTLVLGIADANTPDVTLELDEALTGVAPAGTELEFDGVASSFTTEPFMVMFDVEKANLSGWPAPAAPAPKKAAPKKAAAPKQ